MTTRALLCHPADTVGIALEPLAPGETVRLGGRACVIAGPVPKGHKFALAAHAAGEAVRRYGETIGRATCAIAAGEHVHSHNLATALAGEHSYAAIAAHDAPAPTAAPLPSWQGYRRADGRFATRNEVWLLPTVGCVAPLAEMAAREAAARHAGRIDAVAGFGHPHGCSQLGDDLAGTRAALAGLCDNPNAGGVVLIGLGCETNQLDALIEAVPERSRAKLRVLRAQDAGDELAAVLALVDDCVDELAPVQREEAHAAGISGADGEDRLQFGSGGGQAGLDRFRRGGAAGGGARGGAGGLQRPVARNRQRRADRRRTQRAAGHIAVEAGRDALAQTSSTRASLGARRWTIPTARK